MNINSLQIDDGSNIYYDEVFRNVLDNHYTFLKTTGKVNNLNIEPVYADKYEGDLSGLLTHYKIPLVYHWVIMRLNDFTSFNENSASLVSLLIPDFDLVEQIRQVHRTVSNKIRT